MVAPVPGDLSVEDVFRVLGPETWDRLRRDELGTDKVEARG